MTQEERSSDVMLFRCGSDDKHKLSFEDPIRKLITLKSLFFTEKRTQGKVHNPIMIRYFYCNRAIKREDEKSLEESLNEAIVDSSLDTPVPPKPGMYNYTISRVNLISVCKLKQLPCSTIMTSHFIPFNFVFCLFRNHSP